MRILFLHSNSPDYLSASLFHGLREVLGKNCIDLPKFDCMYKPLLGGVKKKIRGNAFSLYGLLDDLPELITERFFIWQKNIEEFDYYVIADIWNCWEAYIKLSRVIPEEKIIVIDPADTFRFFPFNNYRSDFKLLLFKFLFLSRNSKYFKREVSDEVEDSLGLGYISKMLYPFVLPKNILPIHFSIPAEKISYVKPENKDKLWTGTMVDEEIAARTVNSLLIPMGKENYKFNQEVDYYRDIQKSKFGITSKRSGWDCLRHYEYAANGAVLCFKNGQSKPIHCAPYGLDSSNSIFYDSYQDLMSKINSISEDEYVNLLSGSYKWIENNTTVSTAQRFLQTISTK